MLVEARAGSGLGASPPSEPLGPGEGRVKGKGRPPGDGPFSMGKEKKLSGEYFDSRIKDPIIDLYLESSEDVTLAISRVKVEGRGRNGKPESYEAVVNVAAKKHREDKPNAYIGNLMATGRALEILGKKLQKAAWGEVKHADNMKKEKLKKGLSSS